MNRETQTASVPQSLQPQGMRTFLIIWLGQVISIIGSGLTTFALGVWIFEQTGQATPFALTVLFGTLPRILLFPVAGSLADRWNRRWMMILSDTGSALVTLSTAGLLFTGRLEIWHVYLFALLGALFGAFQEPAYSASVTMLVAKKDFARASGMVQMSQALEMLIAPLLAGILFGAIGLRGILMIDFITFLFGAGALLLVHIPQPPLSESDAGKAGWRQVWRDAGFGWRYLQARPGLFGLVWYFALVNFLLNISAVLTFPLVLSFATAAVLGTVQMVSGLGMLAGSLVMSAWGGPQRRRSLAVIGFIALAAAGLLVMSVKASAVMVAAGLFLLMFSVPLGSGTSQAIFQTKVAPEVQGRVFSIRAMIGRSMMPLAYLLAGPLADRVFEPLMSPGGAFAGTFVGAWLGIGTGRGIGLMFLLAGLILLLASGVAAANRDIRSVEEDLPDAVAGAGEAPAPAAAVMEQNAAEAAAD